MLHRTLRYAALLGLASLLAGSSCSKLGALLSKSKPGAAPPAVKLEPAALREQNAAPSGPPLAAAPLKLAAESNNFGVIEGPRVLLMDNAGKFSSLGLDGQGQAEWSGGWDAEAAGWSIGADNSMDATNFTVSPDGLRVAYSKQVNTELAGQNYDNFIMAIVLASAKGGDGRCVALCDVSDGGPQIDFSMDSSRLCGLWFYPGEPSVEQFKKLMGTPGDDGGDGEKLWATERYNFVETATGKRGETPGMDLPEYYDKCPFSDNIACPSMDDPSTIFSNFLTGGELGRYTPLSADVYMLFSSWVLPDAELMQMSNGRQILVRVDGSSKDAKGGPWRCFCVLPDGTSLFSRDGGVTLEYGKVNWGSFHVDWSVARPDLAQFAEPFDESGWPSKLHTWKALPDSRGILVRDPEDGALYLFGVSREAAKP